MNTGGGRQEALWDDERSLKQRAFAVYLLLLASSVTFGMTGIAGAVLAYLSQDRARRTFLESHFAGQLKTFWYAVAICIAGWLSYIVIIGFFIGWVFFLAATVWLVYRCALGLLHLKDNREL